MHELARLLQLHHLATSYRVAFYRWRVAVAGLFACVLIVAIGPAHSPVQAVAVEAGQTRPSPHIREVRGVVRGQLDRYELLLRNGHVDEAIGLISRILDGTEILVGTEFSDRAGQGAVGIGDSRYVGLSEYCHHLLAQLPPPALARYRQTVDSIAESWYTQGIAQRDERQLRRVVDRMFCSRWGDDALLALGELALQRADYQQARNDWQRISRRLRSQAGKTLLWSTYPDADLDLAAVRARLTLVSIRAGQWDRAGLEIDLLRQFYPNARGHFGGREVNFAEHLSELLAQARDWPPPAVRGDWPTFAGAAQRTNAATQSFGNRFQQQWKLDRKAWAGGGEASRYPASPLPIVAGNVLLFGKAGQIHAVDLATGRPACGRQSAIFSLDGAREVSPSARKKHPKRQRQSLIGLSAAGDRVFATFAAALPAFSSFRAADRSSDVGGSRLVGLDLNRDGALFFRQAPRAKGWMFAGAPIVVRAVPNANFYGDRADGDRVLVATVQHDVRRRISIACFDVASQRLLWRREVCELDNNFGDDFAAEKNQHASTRVAPVMLTVDSGIVYCNTNCGAIAAMRASDGHLLWIRTYPRTAVVPTTSSGRAIADGLPCPVIFCRGLLLIVPTDSCELLALDAADGAIVWRRPTPARGARLVGVAGEKLVLSGSRLWAFRTATGELLAGWGDETAGKNGRAGQGAIAGDTIYWPARCQPTGQAILAVDIASGQTTEIMAGGEPWRLSQPSDAASASGSTHVIVAGGRLVVANGAQIFIFQQAVSPADNSADNAAGTHAPDRHAPGIRPGPGHRSGMGEPTRKRNQSE